VCHSDLTFYCLFVVDAVMGLRFLSGVRFDGGMFVEERIPVLLWGMLMPNDGISLVNSEFYKMHVVFALCLVCLSSLTYSLTYSLCA
jgi:hypothetical protein